MPKPAIHDRHGVGAAGRLRFLARARCGRRIRGQLSTNGERSCLELGEGE
jgi:hypothetical protein